MKFLFFGCFVASLTLFSFQIFKTNKQDISLQEIIKTKGIKKKDLLIFIEKKKRKLSVKFGEEFLISYDCVLGFTPEGDKMQEGDGKTPEGSFDVRAMYPHKSWKYFIWIDYPNQTSKQRFNNRRNEGIISKSATIGGEVGIHGVPDGSDYLINDKIDWTLGCISLKNSDIKDLYLSISKDTKIEIVE